MGYLFAIKMKSPDPWGIEALLTKQKTGGTIYVTYLFLPPGALREYWLLSLWILRCVVCGQVRQITEPL